MKCCEDVRGSECHCGKCHQTFQDVDYTRAVPVACKLPPEIGAVQDARGTWCTPERLKAREILATRLASLRSGQAHP